MGRAQPRLGAPDLGSQCSNALGRRRAGGEQRIEFGLLGDQLLA